MECMCNHNRHCNYRFWLTTVSIFAKSISEIISVAHIRVSPICMYRYVYCDSVHKSKIRKNVRPI
jgi:hypothetical protein